jgi:putative DNA primase/helicase
VSIAGNGKSGAPAASLSEAGQSLLNAYEASGFRLVPLKPDKKGKGKFWQTRPITRAEIEHNLETGGNVGIQAGEVSGWICAVDLDAPEARELAPQFLPKTLTSGKENERLPSHYVYISEGAGYRRFMDTNVKELIALKASENGRGHQFVVEPSVHETKGPYRWSGGFDLARITRISSEDLERRLQRLAAAVLIARHLPEEGRHFYSLWVAGFLLRHGEDEDSVIELMRPAWELASADHAAIEQMERNVRDTKENLDRDKPVAGGGKLHEAVPQLPSRLSDALGWRRKRAADGERRDYELTDDGNALRFVDRYEGLIRYCPPWRTWLVWDGQRWLKGAEGKVVRMARTTARSIHHDAADAIEPDNQKRIGKWAIQSQHRARIEAMIALARSDERVEVDPDAFDADPWLLTVENGTLELRTGKLRDHDPADLITKLAPVRYDPHARAERFERFLSEIFERDADLIGFVQRFAGYSLTGSTEERVVAMLHGSGKNGKTTLIELLRHVLGDYAKSTDVETILAKRYSGVGNDVAALKGARFVSTSEIDKGRDLAESKIKQLTGSDTVTARFLFSEPFDFRPEFKLWISTNNRPNIKGMDNAIWDRLRLIPFGVRFEGDDLDKELPAKLHAESAGVLAWMVRGCLEWQQDGLGSAASVEAATLDYRADMDTYAAFIEECCIEGPDKSAPSKALYSAYIEWCTRNGEPTDARRTFGRTLKERGYKDFKYTSGPHRDLKGWRGLGLVAEHDPDGQGRISYNGSKLGSESAEQTDESGARAEQHSAPENSSFAGETSEKLARAEQAERKSITSDLVQPREREDLKVAPLAPLAPLPDHSHVYTFKPDGSGMACRECGISYADGLAQEQRARAERDGTK